MAKKTNSKATKKPVAKEEPVMEESKKNGIDNMSLDEIANMFIQNDVEAIERLKKENEQTQIIEDPEKTETEKPNELEKLANEVVAECPKENPKPKSEHESKKPESEKHNQNEKPKQTPQQPNTNRAVYGYDHFGIIYGY
jgi:hypothetical protein